MFLNLATNFTNLLLSIYLPCSNYCNIVSREYNECIDYFESLIVANTCNSFICCGDYNTCFERENVQTECLNNFIYRSNLVLWNNTVSKNNYICKYCFKLILLYRSLYYIQHTTYYILFLKLLFVMMCKSWNIVVRLILGLPHNAHTYLLGPLMGQTGIREQLYIRIFLVEWLPFE